MDTRTFSATTSALIENWGQAGHKAVAAYRQGGERLASTFEQRWKAALKETSPKLTPETRKNAARAQEAFGGLYAKGLALSAEGAEIVIGALVGTAVAAVERTAAFRQANANAKRAG